MGIYGAAHQVSAQANAFKDYDFPDTDLFANPIADVDARLKNKLEYVSDESMDDPLTSNQEANQIVDKVQRRLAQNREAARKSRLKKKAYVRQLETTHLKLTQLELELEKVRQQGVYSTNAINNSRFGFSRIMNPGIGTFEMQYGIWINELRVKDNQLRNALQALINDIEIRFIVESSLDHYYKLFHMKAEAAKSDIFYLLSGTWRTSAERLFLWIGGSRPSKLLNVLMRNFEPLSDEQVMEITRLVRSCEQAEDALSQGMEKLHQSLAHTVAFTDISVFMESNNSHMREYIEKLEALQSFAGQADHLRQQTLLQMSRILTTKQAGRGLLALGEYFHRLRALSSVWCNQTLL